MKQEIDNNAMWAVFRQKLALQGELQVVAAIDNALNNLGFTIEETSTIVPIPLKQGSQNLANSAKTCKIEQKHTPKHRVGDTIYYNSFGELKSMIVANVVTDSTDNPMYEDKEGNAVFEKAIIEQTPVNIDYISGIRKGLLDIENNAENINGLTESQWVAIRAAHRLLGEYIVKEQDPAWSEKDEFILEIITSVLQVNFEPNERFSGYEEYMNVDLINWLKSLKERYTWKPSDEQITSLDTAIAWCIGDKEKVTLKSLLNDLKKLKG